MRKIAVWIILFFFYGRVSTYRCLKISHIWHKISEGCIIIGVSCIIVTSFCEISIDWIKISIELEKATL